VRTTGIYCRPVCSARRPHADNVAFYDLPEQAPANGYRPRRPDRVVRLERDGVSVRPATAAPQRRPRPPGAASETVRRRAPLPPI
jgi:methylphosphotriester-DNA--protein-cysteine methyltransferase